MNDTFKYFKEDLPASIVVFFVAVPLCLGIAMASGAPLFAGVIAGIVGGIVVGAASGSALGVSGPAAGLTVIVLDAIGTLGSWEAFLVSVVLAGVLQIAMGFAKLGAIAYYFPSSVIKGMLSGIGLIIILKQIPHAFGYDKDYEGDLSFFQADGENTLSELMVMLDYISPAAIIISVSCLAILILWDQVLMNKHKIFKLIPGPIAAVVTGIIINLIFENYSNTFYLEGEHMVQIPVASSINDFFNQFTTPAFSTALFGNLNLYLVAGVMAVVASLETLLCVEATDKLDPHKNVTPTNRELKAQGIGNIVSGLIGGLPVTQVIVRSSANISFGGRTKLSTILHGIFILVCVIAFPGFLNLIPLAALASILFVVGYKLSKPALFKQIYNNGWEQFVPFVATVVGVVLTDLLIGIGIGMVIGFIIILKNNYKTSYEISKSKTEQDTYEIKLSEQVSFLNKGSILQKLNEIPKNSHVNIDGTESKVIDFDVVEIIKDFQISAKNKNIKVTTTGINIED